jgi:hypothetical protein
VPLAPRRVRWTARALEKAALLGIARSDVARVVVERHSTRRRNARSADWLVTSRRLVIAYDHPDHDDPIAARIVTLWRRR